MAQKERYVCKKISKDCLFPEILCELKDTESKFFVVLESKDDAVKIADLLNQQDKRIKELEEKYQDLKEDNNATTESLYASRTYLDKNTSKMWKLEKENQQLKEKLNNFETCMKKYNVEDIEHLDLMLFVLSGGTKYHLKEIEDKHKKELKQSQKQLAISELEKVKNCCEIYADELYDNLVDVVLSTDIDKPKREAMKYLYLVSEFIDNQIKELKKGEDEK